MSSVRQALLKLDLAVDKLENSLESLAAVPAGAQRDMFASPSNQNATRQKSNGVVSAPVLARPPRQRD